ncbi:MAG: SRPBCC family protein [Acidobacteriota bacterium]|nr:SRPBCC family protein [Acidobacteriota bacterium]
MQDHIEKQIEITAPTSRVWQALTDSKQFGEWFQVNIDGPFTAGKPAAGQLTYPGYEGVRLEVTVKTIEPETYFAYTWHPNPCDAKADYTSEPPTLVEFRLKPTSIGTLLTVRESGFTNIPGARQAEAFRNNDNGWLKQMESLKTYAEKS